MCLLDVRCAMKDLILFPGDATFQKVEQSAWGRTYVLKFSSSNQRHFVSYYLSFPPSHALNATSIVLDAGGHNSARYILKRSLVNILNARMLTGAETKSSSAT